MIHIINTYPYIEKKVIGQVVEKEFHPQVTSYSLGGFDIVNYLDANKLAYKGYGLIGSNAEELNNMEHIQLLETKTKTRTKVLCVFEEELFQVLEDDKPEVETSDILIYQHIVANQIKKDDLVVLEESEGILSSLQMEELHQKIYTKEGLLVCDFHPKYYDILRDKPCNVLYVDASSLPFKVQSTKEVMYYAKECLVMLANIVIVSVDSHRLFVFHEGKKYKATYHIKDPVKNIYRDAILAGIALCKEVEGDMKYLLKKCLSLSVGASLSSGMYVPSKEALKLIEEKINLVNLNDESELT